MMIRITTAALTIVFPLSLAGQRPAPARTWLAAPVLERTIGDDGNVTLYQPTGLVALDGRTVVTFDWSEMQVRAFSVDNGRQLWSFGRKGSGPREFNGGHQMVIDRDGNLSVLDNSSARLTTLSPTGQFVMSTPIPPEKVGGLLPGRQGEARKMVPRDTVTMWSTLAPGGILRAGASYPQGVRFSSPVVGEAYLAATATGSMMAFRWSDAIIVMDSTGNVARTIRGPERREFPGLITVTGTLKDVELDGIRGDAQVTGRKVDKSGGEATHAIAAAGNELYVLYSGTDSVTALRKIDRFDLRNGNYLGSHLLPHKVAGIAALGGGRIATVESELEPVIRIWRLPVR